MHLNQIPQKINHFLQSLELSQITFQVVSYSFQSKWIESLFLARVISVKYLKYRALNQDASTLF